MAYAPDDPAAGYWDRATGAAPKLAPTVRPPDLPPGGPVASPPAVPAPSDAPPVLGGPGPEARGRHAMAASVRSAPDFIDAPEIRGRHAMAAEVLPEPEGMHAPEIRGRHVIRDAVAVAPLSQPPHAPAPELPQPVAASEASDSAGQRGPTSVPAPRPSRRQWRSRVLPRFGATH